jgi:hypothetical protein
MNRTLGFYPARKRAITQARPDQVAGSDLSGGTNKNPVGILNQGIATMQNFKRRKSVEARVGCVEMRAPIANKALERAVKTSAARGHSFTGLSQQSARIMAHDDATEFPNLALQPVQPIAEIRLQSKAAVVQPLIKPV